MTNNLAENSIEKRQHASVTLQVDHNSLTFWVPKHMQLHLIDANFTFACR